jgi:L-alanine-DL-glutamate epimerase-like enolase superfamily enzyme
MDLPTRMPLEFRCTSLPIPFRFRFTHASATRAVAENVFVQMRDSNATVGLGEGCPRAYVTGETSERARAFLAAHLPSLARVDSLPALREWINANNAAIDAAPSAFCAVELALLDLFSQRAGVTVEALLGLPPVSDQPITAVYSASGSVAFAVQRALFGLNRVREAKLKASGNTSRDRARVQHLARSGRVRVDANNLWSNAPDAIAALSSLERYVWAVEEPCIARDWPAMSAVQEKTGLTIIADESVTRLADISHMPVSSNFVVNLRVSKLGGLLRSLDVLKAATARGVGVIVGAQVGETSLLARAALALASAAGSIEGFEAGYGSWLLRYDVVTPTIKARGGRVLAAQFRTLPGFGLRPSQRLSDSFHSPPTTE